QTDSTRLVTIMLGGSTYVPPIQGVSLGHHDLSHHGKEPGKLAQLKTVEVETMKTVRDLLAKLKQSKEDGASLLDRTTVFLGSNLGDGSSHSVKNLPVLVSGGWVLRPTSSAPARGRSPASIKSAEAGAATTRGVTECV